MWSSEKPRTSFLPLMFYLFIYLTMSVYFSCHVLLKFHCRGVIFSKSFVSPGSHLRIPPPPPPVLSLPTLAQGDFERPLNIGYPKFIIIISTLVLNTSFAVVVSEFTGYSHVCFLPSEQLQVCTTKPDGNVIFL